MTLYEAPLGTCDIHGDDHRHDEKTCYRWRALTVQPAAQERLLEVPDRGIYETPISRIELKKCRTCGRDIIWTTSPSGQALPVDARPAGPHVYAIVIDADVGLRAVKIAPVIDADWRAEDALEADRIFVSHWLTCPRPPKSGSAQDTRGRRPAPFNAGGNASARNAKAAPDHGARRRNL